MSDPISERDDIEQRRGKIVMDAATALAALMGEDMEWNLRHRVFSKDTAIDEAEEMLNVAIVRIEDEATSQFADYLLRRS